MNCAYRLHTILGAQRTTSFQSSRRQQRAEMTRRRLPLQQKRRPASIRTLKKGRSKSALSPIPTNSLRRRPLNGLSLLTRYVFNPDKTCVLTVCMQPLQALEHPKFHQMIAVAARAPKGVGVKIPGRKATRSHIIRLFDSHMRDLRERLSVCQPS